MANNRPGVYITEQLKTSVPGANAPGSPLAVFIGETWKGPDTPTIIKSWSEYVRNYGGFPSANSDLDPYVPLAVYQFFTNGGSECIIARVIDNTGVASSGILVDRLASGAKSTLTIRAKSVGSWGDNLHVKIVDRDDQNGRFDLFVLDGGIADKYTVERFVDLTMDKDDPLYVVTVLNNKTRGSSYIVAKDENSDTAAPDNTPAVDNVQLTGGSDGGSVNNQDYADTVDSLDEIEQPLVINIPGMYTPTVINDLIQYCETRGDSFAIVDTKEGIDSVEAQSYRVSLTSSSYVGVYYPWLTISDPVLGAPGVMRNVPPGGAVMGLYATTDRARGPYKAPAGVNYRLEGVYNVTERLSATELGDLNEDGVNCIRAYPAGAAVMGSRTLKRSGSDRYIPVRRTLIWLKYALTQITEYAIFEPNDERLWESLNNRVSQFLTEFWAQGGLRGSVAQEAFFVKCDREINPDVDIENGIVNIEIGVALQHPAEFIMIKLGQWYGGGSSATDSLS